MRKMKDSGIGFIEKIPESWEIKKLKYIVNQRNEKNIFDNLSYIGLENIESNTGEYFYTEADYDASQSIICRKNDVLFGKLRPYLAKVYLVEIDSCCSSEFVVFKDAEVPSYIKYLFLSSWFVTMVNNSTYGTKMPRANSEYIKNVYVTVPPKTEQQKIADFLDKKCAEIDKLIELQESMIEKLKEYKQSVITQAVTKGLDPDVPMKDSGIEWIGKIPEGWEVSRVGIHYQIILGKMLCSQKLNDDYTKEDYYCAANVHFGEIILQDNLKQMWFSAEEKSIYKVMEKDLLVVEGGAGAGGCAIVEKIDKDIFIQNSIMITRNKTSNDNRYLRYLIESFVKRGYIDVVCNKATIPHFTKDKLSNMPYLAMSADERNQIADYLDKKCAEIDDLIKLKEQKIEKLKEYKKSLIYEYVTGKKEVV